MPAGTELLARTAPGDPAYPSVVAAVSQSAADLAAELVRQAGQLRSEAHAVLTPEQRARRGALEPELQARWQDQRRDPGTADARDAGSATALHGAHVLDVAP